MKKRKILSISYDEPLLLTRQMMLEQAGFSVVSALGFTEAMERCQDRDFDLVLVGHSIPVKDKAVIMAAVKQQCKAPILSIRRHGFEKMAEADYSVDAHDGPAALMAAVKQAFGSAK